MRFCPHYERESLKHSDHEILLESVRKPDVSMLVYMLQERKVRFNGDELMLIAVVNMSHTVVYILCHEMYITPSKLAVSKAFYMIQTLIDDFKNSRGKWSSAHTAIEVRVSLKTLLRCHSFDLGLDEDDRWFPTSNKLKKISNLLYGSK